VIVRKGAVRLKPGQAAVIPSHLSGDVALVEATPEITAILHSMSHGTGRKVSRGDAKTLVANLDFGKMRKTIIMPNGMSTDYPAKVVTTSAWHDND
jgi:RNA-splicing ligase RtcB